MPVQAGGRRGIRGGLYQCFSLRCFCAVFRRGPPPCQSCRRWCWGRERHWSWHGHETHWSGRQRKRTTHDPKLLHGVKSRGSTATRARSRSISSAGSTGSGRPGRPARARASSAVPIEVISVSASRSVMLPSETFTFIIAEATAEWPLPDCAALPPPGVETGVVRLWSVGVGAGDVSGARQQRLGAGRTRCGSPSATWGPCCAPLGW